ncbi:MAG: mercury methylation corrinoid protein HgcA [Actinomycetota bacterium]
MEGTGIATSRIGAADRLVHLLARLGVKRNEWRVRPGLYALGDAGPDSPVFVSANYRLSFDALRQALEGMDAYILVLDTKGVNVWCSAGKGSFGTGELVARIEKTGLAGVVSHRTLIAPQLCATGVAAHEVRRRSGFRVKFGPVRAEDIKDYMANMANGGKATPEMRRVRFGLRDRAVLVPVEAVNAFPVAAGASSLAVVAGDAVGAAGIASASAAGLVAFPLLLPWLPGEDFSLKGFALGGLVGLGAAAASLARDGAMPLPLRAIKAASYALALPPVTAFIGLNFTGCTTYTSPSGVRREMNRYIPVMAGMAGAGLLANVAARVAHAFRGEKDG